MVRISDFGIYNPANDELGRVLTTGTEASAVDLAVRPSKHLEVPLSLEQPFKSENYLVLVGQVGRFQETIHPSQMRDLCQNLL